MRIALVHDWLNGMRGGEKVLEALIQLYPGSDIFTLFCDPSKLSPLLQGQHITTSPLQHFPGILRHYRRLLPLFPWAIKRFDLRDYDLVISVSHCVAKSAVAASPKHHFCYCLSPMRYLWSHYDQYSSARQTNAFERLGMGVFQSPLRKWDRATSCRAGRYVAISRAIAQRIQSSYGREAGMVYPPVDTDFFTPAENPKSDYFLAVSAAVPYKRLDLAVHACDALGRSLKIVGGGPGMDTIRAIAGPTVEVLGWVSNEDLRELYRNCTALIFPPEEDFGIAPLEANACGKPVIAFAKGGALETVVAGKTGEFFHEQTPESLIESMRRFNAKSYDPEVIRGHACGFGNARFAQEFQDEIQRFLEGRSLPVESSSCMDVS